jgi:argininosuccinate lyase
MDDTGRIKRPLTLTARRILFDGGIDAQITAEMEHACMVDQAHLVMLAEAGLVDWRHASRLAEEMERLRACAFQPLLARSAPRGLYLAYEDYLSETQGIEVAGILQTARSRNDLNATVLRLRLRRPFARLLLQVLRFEAVMIRLAKRYAGLVMPAYTHGQAAVPVTYGHYLAGVATALNRDSAALASILDALDTSPLGACAGGGTSLPINTRRTANLLGFGDTAPHSTDAVASRDSVLRLLAALAIYGITLSRVAADLRDWTTAEFDFLRLPDDLTGSSSSMPQKRNPFLLEHIEGRSASALGAFVTAAAAMRSTAFANSISVGTEGVRPLWQALDDLSQTTVLARLVVAAAKPNAEAMLRAATRGFTTATALADRLVLQGGLSFRSAHRLVGEAVWKAAVTGSDSLDAPFPVSMFGLDPASVAAASDYGGGPGLSSISDCLERLRHQWGEQLLALRIKTRQWKTSRRKLAEAVQGLRSGALAATPSRFG